MVRKILPTLLVLLFLNHCEFRPIYSDIGKVNFKLNILEIEGDKELNDFVYSNIKKYSNVSSNKIINLVIKTKYTKEDLIKNKKGEVTTFLLKSEIIFQIKTDQNQNEYKFSEQIKAVDKNDKFEFKRYEQSVKNNFINSKMNEFILKLTNV